MAVFTVFKEGPTVNVLLGMSKIQVVSKAKIVAGGALGPELPPISKALVGLYLMKHPKRYGVGKSGPGMDSFPGATISDVSKAVVTVFPPPTTNKDPSSRTMLEFNQSIDNRSNCLA